MPKAWVALGAVVLSAGAGAQIIGQPQSAEPGMGKTVPPVGDADEGLAAPGSGWGRLVDANGHMRESDYRAVLASQLAQAEAMLAKPLTERDRGKIRSALQADLIAWRKQYDPRRADYRAIREQYLVDENALSPEAWAKQRIAWLRAQHEWILANVGEERSAPAVRVR